MDTTGFLPIWEDRFSAYLRELGISDGSHDLSHFQRVWKTANYINRQENEPADPLVLLTAAYFHDLIALPKNHPQRQESSRLSAERTGELLVTEFPGFPQEKIPAVQHAIHAHSFSAAVPPLTPEAKILQDADRLEALGAIGAARTFYIAGQLGTRLFDPEDPLAEHRPLDDRTYALDHFTVKLLKLPALMNTAAGRRLAEENAAWLRDFMRQMHREITGDWDGNQ